MEKIDARGLSCPQPVLMLLEATGNMKSGEIEVLIDNECSRENVSRAAVNSGWNLTKSECLEGDVYCLRFIKV